LTHLLEQLRRIALHAQRLDARQTDLLDTVHGLGCQRTDPISTIAPPQAAARSRRVVGAGDAALLAPRAAPTPRPLSRSAVSIGVMEFETRAIHAGQEPDPATGAIITPIYQTSTFVQEAVGQHKGYDYARVANPTRTALQVALASLEDARHGVAFSSGLGATTTLMHLVHPRERVVLIADVYGGVYRMTSQVYEPKGYRFTYVPAAGFDEELPGQLDEDVRLVWVETPSNPMLNIVDIRRAADAAHAVGALLVVDNTFATPYLQQPLALGADAVVHSTTKYLGGHSDVVGGFVATSDDALAERLFFLQKSLGAVPGPFDAWLVLRGVKTLAVRMARHCENARRVAELLDGHPAVERVLYPGLPSHPGHEIARMQMRDFGGMVSFLAESEQEAVELVARTRLFQLAESLGGVESLIEHPARMTHASTAAAPFAPPRNLVRLSVGIESSDDLLADLEAALARRTAAAGA
jgi:cystathionine gamma-synthase